MANKTRHPDTYIIIPAYNEGPAIRQVLEEVEKKFQHVVCVNDGSRDNTAKEIAKTGAILVSHHTNYGQGAALQTGIEYALRDPKAEYFVTFDADGQHSLKDVEKMLDYIKHHTVDIVLGSRFLGTAENMSTAKKYLLKGAVIFNNAASGIRLTDAHNGLRVFNRSFAQRINITMPDMSHASEITRRIGTLKVPYKELPTTVTYSEYSVQKSHNPGLNAVNIVFDTMLNKVLKK